MVLVDLSVESFGRFLKYFMVEKEPPKGKLVFPSCIVCPLHGYPERDARGRLACPPCSLSSGYPKKCSRGRLVRLSFTTKFILLFLAP